VSCDLIQSTCTQNLTILASAVPEIILGASKFKVGHMTLTTPLLRVICHPLLGLDIAYMHAKFDHSSFSHSRDMVGASKCNRKVILLRLTSKRNSNRLLFGTSNM